MRRDIRSQDHREKEVIAVSVSPLDYTEIAPFHPAIEYPEALTPELSDTANPAYDGVRDCFRIASLDSARFGSRDWNPLGELIAKGETVVLKPNLVKHTHPRDVNGWRYVLTHGSVIRAVADYVFKAVGPKGKVLIADAPQTDSSFAGIVKVLQLDRIVEYYRSVGLSLELVDLRNEEWTAQDGVITERRQLGGDPYGKVAFDLGDFSEFSDHKGGGHYYGADYDEGVVNQHHTNGRHEYLISGTVVRADVLFSLPKLKTHKKAGITVSLKNLVGVNADKNWLPHHTEGAPSVGGDEHPNPSALHRLERIAVRSVRQLLAFGGVGAKLMRRARKIGEGVFGDTETVVRSGNWWGNDTIWRMCLDLNKIVMYGKSDGTFRPDALGNRKRHFVLVDGIIAGQGRGPMNPDPVDAGILLFGTNPVSVDAVSAYLMGFNPENLPIVANAFRCISYPLTFGTWNEIKVSSNRREWQRMLRDIEDADTFHFIPHFGWQGRIERESKNHLR
jgi:uncharacterized protein (DUF362 family)